MGATDPRAHREDLLEWEVTEEVDAERFAEIRAMEAYRSGWVAVGFVFDDEGRLLLAYEAEEGHWLAPGGTLEPGETLAEGLRREVREETGVHATAAEPRGVYDVVTLNEAGPEVATFTVVFLEAVAETTAVDPGSPLDDEAFVDAGWFEELPDDVYNHERVEDVLAECERWRG